jgi:hypothetical protein
MRDALTEALVAPPLAPSPGGAPALWRDALDEARRTLAALAARRPAGPARVTGHTVRTALAATTSAPWGDDRPFTWSARTARRPVGLAAVRALVAGEAAAPADAVRARVAEASRLVRDGAAVASAALSVDRWLVSLSPAGRAAVGAAAVTWATRLWCGVDWDALAGPVVIGRDHWWDSPHTSLLALRSRAEVRTAGAHLVVLSGPRRDSVRAELALVVLVESLRSRDGAPPGRVVGWWPESGHVVRVDPEPQALALGTAAVTRVLHPGRGVAPGRAA